MANGSSTRDRFRRAIEEEEETTRGSTEEVSRFDPVEASRRAARAQFSEFREDLGEDFERLRGRQVGAGRLRTGFGFQDQDRFLRDRLDRLDRTLAQQALTASGQELGRLGLLSRNRGRFFDLLSGELDRQTAGRNARRQSRSNLVGSIFGAAGGLGGLF